MRYVVLALVLSLAACAHKAPVNQAVYHAGTLTEAKPACLSLGSGSSGSPDTALCAVGGKVLLYCWSGRGAGSDCAVLGNWFPKKEEQQARAPMPSSPTPAATATPAGAPVEPPKVEASVEPAKVDASALAKPEDKKPADKPAPPKKSPPKK